MDYMHLLSSLSSAQHNNRKAARKAEEDRNMWHNAHFVASSKPTIDHATGEPVIPAILMPGAEPNYDSPRYHRYETNYHATRSKGKKRLRNLWKKVQYEARRDEKWESARQNAMNDYVDRFWKWYERTEAREQANAIRDEQKKKRQEAKQKHAARKAELDRVFHGRIDSESYAGLSPWNPMYGDFKKLTKKQLEAMGANYQGVKSPKKKTIQLADGTTAEVIDSELGVPLGFSQMYGYKGASETVTDENGMTSTAYAEKAFDGKHKTVKSGGCGHIAAIEYSRFYQLLKVTFARGDVVIFYRVPAAVAGELLHFAETGQTSTNTFDGSVRHVLGIRFWDLVRIRGTKHGSRYRFEYTDKMEAGADNGRPREYVYERTIGEHGVTPGYDTNELKDWLAEYRQEHGHNPSPNEFAEKTKELRMSSSAEGIADRKEHGTSYNKRGTKVKITDLTDFDTLNDYFDGGEYNKDLSNKQYSNSALTKAYNMYDSLLDKKASDITQSEVNEITKMLSRAGKILV